MSDEPITDASTDAELLTAVLWALERAHKYDAPGIRGQTLSPTNPMIVRFQCSAGFLGICSDRLRAIIEQAKQGAKP